MPASLQISLHTTVLVMDGKRLALGLNSCTVVFTKLTDGYRQGVKDNK